MAINSKTLKVIGEQTMHCGGCESTVAFALKQLPGVQQVEASHKTQRIDLTFDPQLLDLERVRQELAWTGYQVAEVEER
jgi:Cd2+/Zn2+-exporting ATPase